MKVYVLKMDNYGDEPEASNILGVYKKIEDANANAALILNPAQNLDALVSLLGWDGLNNVAWHIDWLEKEFIRKRVAFTVSAHEVRA